MVRILIRIAFLIAIISINIAEAENSVRASAIAPLRASATAPHWVSFSGKKVPAPAKTEIAGQERNSVLVDMTLEGMNVQERDADGMTFQFLSLPQAGWTDETGKPKLPVVRTMITISGGDDLEVQIENEEHVSFGNYNVYPVGKEVVRNSRSGEYIDEEFTINKRFYSTNSQYPQDMVRISFSGYLRDQHVVQLEFHPIRYIPSSGELVCYSFLRARLTYKNGIGIATGELMAPSAYMARTFQDGTTSYPDDLMYSNNADYVIIAPEPFYSSPKLKQLAEWRAQYSGIDVAVVSAEKLYYSFGSIQKPDETIRNFIRYVYYYWKSRNTKDNHIAYVLLIGDVEFIPAHTSDMQSFDETIVTDNWYACISGDDLMPDIMLGRLPAKDISEQNIMVDKIIQYEQNPLYGDWANNALLMTGTVDSLNEDMRRARDEYLLPAGYNVNVVAALDGGDTYKAVSELNRGQHIMDYAGHGFVDGWELFQAQDIAKLNNDRMLPVIFSLACSTGHFDHPDKDSLGEAFVKARNGAIAFFGASRLAAISDVGFGLSEAITKNIYTLGEIIMHTKLKLIPYSTNMELYNLLGDPALDIGAPRRLPGMSDITITPVDISFNPDIPKQGNQVQMKVCISNFGAADAQNITLELRDGGSGGKLIETKNIPIITAGKKTEILVTWDVPVGQPQHLIYTKAYTQNTSDEYYLENNDAQKQLLVSLETDGWPQVIDDKTLSAPVIADVNNDGMMELLMQNHTYDNVNKIYILNYKGQYIDGWPKTIYRKYNYEVMYANSSAGPVPSVGDLDGDGAPEIVAVFFSEEIYAWRSDGSNLPGWPVKASGYATSTPVLADLDSDRKLEVIAGMSNGQIQIIKYDGSQFPGWPVSVGRKGHLFTAVADIDGDSDLEIIALHSPILKNYDANSMSSLYVWHHDGTVVKGFPAQMQGTNSILPAAAGDINGDGKAEIIAISSGGNVCRVYVWNHEGSLAEGWPIIVENEIRSSPILSDMDRDGDIEIIACLYNDLVYAWHHNGRQVYGWPVNVPDGYGISAPIISDIDGDYQMEVVYSSYGGIIYAYKDDGTYLEGWPAVMEDNTIVSPSAVADIDGNGKLELVYSTNMGKVHVLSLAGTSGIQNGAEWNMFLHDQMHTGSYNAKVILPLSPTDIIAADLTDDKGGSIVLSWKLSPDDDRASGYVIYRSDKSDGRYSIIGRVQRGTSQYTDNTAQTGVTYWYIVRTSDGMRLSTDLTFVSAYSFNNFAPEPPASVYVNENMMDGVIDIWWSVAQDADIIGYRVYMGTSPGTYDKPIEAGMTNHYALTGLTNDKEYYLSVSAYDIEGNESIRSSEIVAIPKDEDTELPVFSDFYPKEAVEETDFYIRCTISDASGIYDDQTGAEGQGIYLIWDNSDTLSENSHIVRMSLMYNGIYVTDSKIPGQAIDAQFIYQVYAYDNDFDWERINDRARGASQIQTIKMVPPPSTIYNYPNPAPAGKYTDRTIFRYYVNTDSKVKISIYDTTGNLVDKLESEARGGVYNEKEWDISEKASGIYVYVMEIQPHSGERQIVKKKLAIVK